MKRRDWSGLVLEFVPATFAILLASGLYLSLAPRLGQLDRDQGHVPAVAPSPRQAAASDLSPSPWRR